MCIAARKLRVRHHILFFCRHVFLIPFQSFSHMLQGAAILAASTMHICLTVYTVRQCGQVHNSITLLVLPLSRAASSTRSVSSASCGLTGGGLPERRALRNRV